MLEKFVSGQIDSLFNSLLVNTYSLLGELPGTLVLGVPQQFDNATLVGSKTSNLFDDFTDKGSAAGKTALAAADTGFRLDGGGFL